MFGQGLLKGLGITWRRMLSRKHTVEYPDEKIPMFPRFHGRFELDVDKCIACMLCVNACPNKVIQIEREKVDKKQYLTKYVMQIEYCLFCGLCVEACSKCAIKFSSVLDMSQYRRDWVHLVLADRHAPVTADPPMQVPAPAEVARIEAAASLESGKEAKD